MVAKDGMTADGLSTAISVLEPGKGLQLARKYAAEARETRELESGGRIDAATKDFWKRVVWIK